MIKQYKGNTTWDLLIISLLLTVLLKVDFNINKTKDFSELELESLNLKTFRKVYLT